jgi:hypothetical protein
VGSSKRAREESEEDDQEDELADDDGVHAPPTAERRALGGVFVVMVSVVGHRACSAARRAVLGAKNMLAREW